jgi:hypothetical protein
MLYFDIGIIYATIHYVCNLLLMALQPSLFYKLYFHYANEINIKKRFKGSIIDINFMLIYDLFLWPLSMIIMLGLFMKMILKNFY